MKFGSLGPVPWDMVVFFSITTVGFGFSVKRIMNPSYEAAAERSYERANAEESSRTLDLGCVERKLRSAVTSEDGSVRLRGQLCNLTSAQIKEFGNLRVRNTSTGTEGTVFIQGNDNSFVTDFFKLQAGKNVIQIEWRESKTSAPRTYVAEVLEK